MPVRMCFRVKYSSLEGLSALASILITYYLSLVTYHSLLITYFLSLSTYHLLLITYYLSLSTYHLLLITHHFQFITYHSLLITYCLSLIFFTSFPGARLRRPEASVLTPQHIQSTFHVDGHLFGGALALAFFSFFFVLLLTPQHIQSTFHVDGHLFGGALALVFFLLYPHSCSRSCSRRDQHHLSLRRPGVGGDLGEIQPQECCAGDLMLLLV